MSASRYAVVVGVGELGGVFAKGLLRTGHVVVPVRRGDDLNAIAEAFPSPEVVVVAVGEGDLAVALDSLPPAWASSVVLLQNELLPVDWSQLECEPTVAVVWFEKKPGMDSKALLPTLVAGPKAAVVEAALQAVAIPARVIADGALIEALVAKNVYILTTNCAGVKVGGDVGTLWREHRPLADGVAADVIALQRARAGIDVDAPRLLATLEQAIDADPLHKCAGRSAPARLARALRLAEERRIDVPTLRSIAG